MVKPKKVIKHKLRRFMAPTLGLRKGLFYALLGLLFFTGGLTLSFKPIFRKLVDQASDSWNQLLSYAVPNEALDITNHLLGGVFLILGGYLLYKGISRFFGRVIEILTPDLKSKPVNVYVRRQQLAQGPRIVALGGGTGLSTLLRGLKQHSKNITAIVTVTDDGGSSGRLVQEMGIIPPGDLRNCLVALADAERVMTDLFQHRFKNISGSLSGHSIGNLLIAALVEQCGGDFQLALNRASEVLAIRGHVIPSTLNTVKLRALMEDESEIFGETQIVQSGLRVRRMFLDPEDAVPHPEALEAIHKADLVCIGPGSVYTSVIPNLLVPGIAKAIHDSPATSVYICNVMTQRGESDSFTAAEHFLAIQANVEQSMLDYVMVNTALPSSSAIKQYRELNQYYVEPNVDRIRAMGMRLITGNFMSESDYVRHDPLKVASRLIDLINRGK